jgi:hypothetical protein
MLRVYKNTHSSDNLQPSQVVLQVVLQPRQVVLQPLLVGGQFVLMLAQLGVGRMLADGLLEVDAGQVLRLCRAVPLDFHPGDVLVLRAEGLGGRRNLVH